MVSLEFNGLGADEINRHPEAQVLLVTKDNLTKATGKVLDWLTWASSPLTGDPFSSHPSPSTGEDSGEGDIPSARRTRSLPRNTPSISLMRASAVEAIRVHNLELARSNPAPATEYILTAPPGEEPICFQAVDNFRENP